MRAVDLGQISLFAVAQSGAAALGVCSQDLQHFEAHTKRQKHHIPFFPSPVSKFEGYIEKDAERRPGGLVL